MLSAYEFAIRKEHTYATCVMDLESGEMLWVGEGWSKEIFERIFMGTDPSLLVECYGRGHGHKCIPLHSGQGVSSVRKEGE